MAKLLAIDYGKVRTGLADTDPLQIIATALATVPTKELKPFLTNYLKIEKTEAIIVGIPMRAHGVPGEIEQDILKFIEWLNKQFPEIPVHREDESYTSIKASQIIFESGTKKKKRQDKTLIDRVSAAIILQQYMDRKSK